MQFCVAATVSLGKYSFHKSLQAGAEAGQSDLVALGLMEANSSIKVILTSQQMLSDGTSHIPVMHRRTSPVRQSPHFYS